MTAPVVRGRAPRERAPRWCAVRVHGELEAANGPGLVVRGMRRYAVAPTLWTVAVHGELTPTLPQVLAAAVLPGRRLVARDRVLRGRSQGEFERSGHRDRDLSEQAAALVAASLLGLAPRLDGEGAAVLDVDPDGPCAGRVGRGDVVVAAGDRLVRTAADLVAALAAGADRLLVLRAAQGEGSGAPDAVTLPPRAGGPTGLQVATHRPRPLGALDVDVLFAAGSSGSSLGLVLALALLDVLTPGSLTGGRHVAATGALDLTGRVGDVGGVREKARAAAAQGVGLLLAPAADVAEGERGARGTGLRVVGVDTVADGASTCSSRPAATPPRCRRPRSARPPSPVPAPAAALEPPGSPPPSPRRRRPDRPDAPPARSAR